MTKKKIETSENARIAWHKVAIHMCSVNHAHADGVSTPCPSVIASCMKLASMLTAYLNARNASVCTRAFYSCYKMLIMDFRYVPYHIVVSSMLAANEGKEDEIMAFISRCLSNYSGLPQIQNESNAPSETFGWDRKKGNMRIACYDNPWTYNVVELCIAYQSKKYVDGMVCVGRHPFVSSGDFHTMLLELHSNLKEVVRRKASATELMHARLLSLVD